MFLEPRTDTENVTGSLVNPRRPHNNTRSSIAHQKFYRVLPPVSASTILHHPTQDTAPGGWYWLSLLY